MHSSVDQVELFFSLPQIARPFPERGEQRDEPELHEADDPEQYPDPRRGPLGHGRIGRSETNRTRHRRLRDGQRHQHTRYPIPDTRYPFHGRSLSFWYALRPYRTSTTPPRRNPMARARAPTLRSSM